MKQPLTNSPGQSLLNVAITVALSGAVFSGSVLSTQALASEIDSNNDSSSNASSTKTYMYPGMGVGAATGTLIAGPIGFVVGGVVGALVGNNQQVETEETASEVIASDDTTEAVDKTNNTAAAAVVADYSESDSTDSQYVTTNGTSDSHTENDNTDINNAEAGIQLAQAGPLTAVIENDSNPQQEDIMNILVSDLSLDVYFRSGSTDIEKFYPARLTAIANLANSLDNIELHLDGYTDRRGDKDQNIALANERIEKVRYQLIDAGVSEDRIVSKAFGEAKMQSAAGNLEAYIFDRRVVIRFERINDTDTTMATDDTVIDSADETTTVSSTDTKSTDTDGQTGTSLAFENSLSDMSDTANHF